MPIESTNNSRQAAWVAIGSFFSFLVGIISPMVLARYFDKADYGTYKQVMYVYNTLLSVFTLGLPKAYAYFLPKYATRYSKDIINKITSIFTVLGLVFSVVLFAGSGLIASFLNNPDLKKALMIFAPTPLFLLPTMGLDGIFASFRQTKYLALYTVLTRLLTIICIILPVILFDGNYIHAIIGFDIASLLTCLIALSIRTLPIRHEPCEKSDLSYRSIFDFSLPLFYASMWGMIISSANQFFISRYYGAEVFADFSNGFMEIPFVGMVIGAVGTVLLPVFSEMDSGNGMNSNAMQLWNSAMIKSAKIIFPMLVYGVFFAKVLMTCMYGDNYSQSTIYFQIKNISSLLYIIPFAPIILAIGKTKQYANVHMIIAFIIVIAEYLVVKTLDSAVYVAVVSEICQALKIYLLMKIISKYASKSIFELLPLRSLTKVLCAAILSGAMSFIIIEFVAVNKFVILIVGFIIYLLMYYGLCWMFQISYRDIFKSLLKDKLFNVYKMLP